MTNGTAALIVVVGLFSAGSVRSQVADNLPYYVPLLPAVKAKAPVLTGFFPCSTDMPSKQN